MAPTDIAHPASSITTTNPFNDSLSAHDPRLQAPTTKDRIEDLLKDQVTAAPVRVSHIDLVWTSEGA